MLQLFFSKIIPRTVSFFLLTFKESLGISGIGSFERELELAVLALHTAHNDFTRVHIDHCTDNAQAQPIPALIHTPGLICLVEAVKDMGNFFLAQPCSGILHPNIGQIVLHIRS